MPFLKELTDDYRAELERRIRSPDKLLGLSTGFEGLDQLTGGWGRGWISYLAAATSAGKTAFVLTQLVKGAAQLEQGADDNATLVLFSLEMSEFVVMTRLLANLAAQDGRGLDSFSLLRGDVNEETEPVVWEEVDKLHTVLGGRVFLDFEAQTTDDFRRLLNLLREDGFNPSLVVVDYFGRVADESVDGSPVSRQGVISRALAALARDFDTHVLTILDLNREGERDERPGLRHLRWGVSAGYDADLVLLLQRPGFVAQQQGKTSDVDPGYAELVLAKNRHGPVGKVELFLDVRTGLYTPWRVPEHTGAAQAAPFKRRGK